MLIDLIRVPDPTSIDDKLDEPLGLLYLGAVLENNGHQVEILDFYKERNAIEQLKQSMKSSDLIGITVNYNDYKTVADISRIIKELDPNIPLVIGGPHCCYHPGLQTVLSLQGSAAIGQKVPARQPNRLVRFCPHRQPIGL